VEFLEWPNDQFLLNNDRSPRNQLLDMIYLLTAIGLSPGGSSTVHIYTKTIHRTTRNKQYIEQHNNLENNTTIWRTTQQFGEQHNNLGNNTTIWGTTQQF